ncbi:MAG: hypothetical protein HKN72_12735 [Gemmatimonadetes bacterium]|nr:hypothetical protein [Gemmatimonadota bacterium]NNF14089.1 hypothetical protein [Gemmatimonadota bacterium]NNL31094.1 hypothetical protein [Gemmatimonadota bacterium]
MVPAPSAFMAVLVATLFLPGSSLFAQSGDRGGLWWGASVQGGGTRLTCDFCDRSRKLGGALEAAIGAYASPQLRVGVEAGVWTRSDDDVREDVYTAGVVAELYPSRDSGLHLVGGVGWSGYRAGDFALDAPRIRLGAGWDLPVASSWVVGNRILLDAASYGSLDNDGDSVARPVGLSMVRFGVYVRRR